MIFDLIMVAFISTQNVDSADAPMEKPAEVRVLPSLNNWSPACEARKTRVIPTLSQKDKANRNTRVVYAASSQENSNYCSAIQASVLLLKDEPGLVAAVAGQTGQSIWESKGPGSASGFFVHKEGLIATNYHVVKDGKKIFARTADGRLYETKTAYCDEVHDIAILSVEKTDAHQVFPALTLGSSKNIDTNDQLDVVGHPLSKTELFISSGKLKSLDQETTRHLRVLRPDVLQDKFLKLSNHIELGISGSAVLDKNAKVVAICFARYCPPDQNEDTLTIATRVEQLVAAIKEARHRM